MGIIAARDWIGNITKNAGAAKYRPRMIVIAV
jgi:hypothetical protein